jgi:predicted MPP superfamily phosphohydrolase
MLYVSDIHLRNGRSDRLCTQVLDAVAGCNPDVVLLGGDLVDSPSELGRLRDLVGRLREIGLDRRAAQNEDAAPTRRMAPQADTANRPSGFAGMGGAPGAHACALGCLSRGGAPRPVLAIGGNHDQWIGMDRVREAVEDGGGQWIHDATMRVAHGRRVIAVSGPDAPGRVDGDVRVLCAHNPHVWKTSRHAGYDLVLAGHLHGCQIVACVYRDRLFPGAMLYPYCFLSRHHDSTRLVVSRGVSDLLPIRWRCPREVVLCYV